MYEVQRDPGDYSRQGAAIAEAMCDWLAAEIVSSSTLGNAYMDNLEAMQSAFCVAMDTPGNLNGQKAISHHSRMVYFMPNFVAQPENDTTAARELFFVQMHLSGLFRKQCILQAKTQEDYIERRIHSGDTLGIDSLPVIENQLQMLHSNGLPSIGQLAESTLALNERLLELNVALHNKRGADLEQEQSPSVTALLEQQEAWLRMAIDHIMVAADIRDGQLERVPFWEPKGMSDDAQPHQIYYPFAA